MIKIETENAPKPIGPYSQAIRTGQYLFVSGQLPINPKTGKVEETTIEGQTRQVLENIKAILLTAGCDFDDVARTEVYLQDLQDAPAMNPIYAEYFSSDIKPARHTLQVARLPLDVRIEITCIAYIEEEDDA
jgi:2-iminobutanoate/2-iminopropanoate deaminase